MTCDAILVSQINHKRVVGLKGEKLGTIEDVVMGTAHGGFSHVILRSRGLFGSRIGARRYAFPFEAITMSANGRTCRLNIHRHELRHLPALFGNDIGGLNNPFKSRSMSMLLGGDYSADSLDFVH